MLGVFRDNHVGLLAIHDLAYCDGDLRRLGQSKLQRFRVLGNSIKRYMTGMASSVRRLSTDWISFSLVAATTSVREVKIMSKQRVLWLQ
jgi:hypothetical protein